MKSLYYLALTAILACYFALTWRGSQEECRTITKVIRRHDLLMTYATWTIIALAALACAVIFMG